jgi:aspartate kinase
MFRALGDERIEARLISTSPIKISCLVDRVDVERGVRALHDAFSLGSETRAAITG